MGPHAPPRQPGLQPPEFQIIRTEEPGKDYYPGLWGAFRCFVGWWKWPFLAVAVYLGVAIFLHLL